MEKTVLTEIIIDSISMQLEPTEITEYVKNNRMKYLKYLMNIIQTGSVSHNNITTNKRGV